MNCELIAAWHPAHAWAMTEAAATLPMDADSRDAYLMLMGCPL